MRIAIVGAGFVGGATGRGFLKHKHQVVFIDASEEKVNALRGGGLEAYLPEQYDKITTDITMVSVPTPTKNNKFQFKFLGSAIADFGLRLKTHNKYHTLVIRSTVPPGTTRQLVIPLVERASGKKVGKDFGIVMQPEYLRQATANEDFERPWFVLIGEYDRKSGIAIDKLYRSFDVPIQHCTLEEAEMQKYVHNVFNAVKIAFFNEMRMAFKHFGWDDEKIFLAVAESCEGIWNPIYGMRDLGAFDGACLPKDTQALLEWGERHGFNFGILKSVITENTRHGLLLASSKKMTADSNEKMSVGPMKSIKVDYLANIKT
ncbi:UDP-glucose/GDP-mannose dehydrogenase family protein [Candidatus Saccharibacteria bacterium]|nr:UDP-glucose/GDP-mannose dehydrogenase family protein [Candidatus Saccharibacteria bacterium]